MTRLQTLTLVVTLLMSRASLSSASELLSLIPSIVVSDSKGETVSLEQFRGKVVYLDIWASWCGTCANSLGWMGELQKRYGSEKFQVVALNVDENRADAEKLLKKVKADVLVHFDPEGKIPEAMGVDSMPTSFVIGRDGKILAVHEGLRESDRKRIEAEILAALSS